MTWSSNVLAADAFAAAYVSPAGAAGGAAAQLAYAQGQRDVTAQLRGSLHDALDRTGLGPLPQPAPVKANTLHNIPDDHDDENDEIA